MGLSIEPEFIFGIDDPRCRLLDKISIGWSGAELSFVFPDTFTEASGIFPATQQRSIKTRDDFINSGISLLNTRRFHELRIPDLAEACGHSVGSFYSRFLDKDAFFRAMQAAVVAGCDNLIEQRLSQQRLLQMPLGEAFDELVDTLADIFVSEGRGVLRESLLKILDEGDPWAPMRDSGRRLVHRLQGALPSRLARFTNIEAKSRVAFCYQTVVGVLQNDLVNDYHAFSTKDGTVRAALKEMLRRYMRLSV